MSDQQDMTAAEWDAIAEEMKAKHGQACLSRYADWQRHRSDQPAGGEWEVEYLPGKDVYVIVARDEPRPPVIVGTFLRRPDALAAAQALWMQAVIRRFLSAFGALTPQDAADLPTALGAPFVDLEDARRCLRAAEGR